MAKSSFDSVEMPLKIYGKNFKTGTVVKLYSYQFPSDMLVCAGFESKLK